MANQDYDKVTKAQHYNSHPSGIECWDVAKYHSFAIGNVFKYLWREGLKDPDSDIEDLEKAYEYLGREIVLRKELREKRNNESI